MLLEEIGEMIKDIPLDCPPPKTGRLIYAKVAEITKNGDPYRELKQRSTVEALALYPFLKERVSHATDRLLLALKLAIAGNAIDYGANNSFNIQIEVDHALNRGIDVCDYVAFLNCLEKTNEVLYIGDNAGETVFDRVLIEELDKPVIYGVRGGPIINDATYEDALQAGIAEVATILSSGSNAPGAILGTCSHEFNEVFRNADLVISKGQGNYEALSNERSPIFFLLKAKCDVIAKHIGAKKGDFVAYNSDRKIIKKLFSELKDRFKNREGGYTRILKMMHRTGDNAPRCLIEFVEPKSPEPQETTK